MIEQDIHARIDEALAGRMSQRSFVDRLVDGWQSLSGGLDRLVELVEAAERSAGQTPGVPQPAQFRSAFDALLRGVDDDGRARPAGLRERLGEAGRRIEAAAARVRRDTVNIGVIGGTKVGKSTLLRTITNLPDTVVPSTRFNPTTAAASSIYHTDGAPSATLRLHTWVSFRDEYLAPLHELAGAGPVPAELADFRALRYARAGSAEAGAAVADDYLRKLDAAHRSLESYEHLLTGPERTKTVDFAALRPYVAYPRKETGDPDTVQPYHAVRGVRIEQGFLEGAATRLGLIDLPGAGEAGLDIDRQFLRQVANEIDLLVMVKRGDRKGASYLAEDSYTRNLADSARGGVQLEDYYVVVVNRDRANDPEGEYFDNTVKSVREASAERGIRVLTADVARRAEVLADVLHPLLRHLAARLAEMDRAVVREALTAATAAAAGVAAYAAEAQACARDLAHLLPDQDDEFSVLAEKLRNALAVDLNALVRRYDAEQAGGAADTALTGAIAEAVGQARQWARGGLGHGDRAAWLADIEGQYVHGDLEAKQDEYYRAKTEVTRIFGRIDPSLDDAVQRLWDEIAALLRRRLTADLVPAGPAALARLRSTAESRRALVIAGALRRLCELKEDYGSVVLRVTQPIIRGIHWDRASPARTSAPAPVVVPAQAETGRWEVQPDGSRRRATAPVITAPQPVQRPVQQPVDPVVRQGAEGLYDELGAVVEACVAELERALQAEARVMTRTLAAAADRFFDSVIRTNRSEKDYEHLCKPNLRSIWPDRFDGGDARLAADLSLVEEQARSTGELAAALGPLHAGLRLTSPQHAPAAPVAGP